MAYTLLDDEPDSGGFTLLEDEPKPKRSLAADFARQFGLTTRAGIKGTVGLLAIPGDLLGFKSSKALDDAMTMAGLPQPETATERVAQDVAGAMAGAGGVAKAVPKLAGEILPSVVSAAGGASGSGVARESGAGPGGQFVAGLAGGMAAPTVLAGLRDAAEASWRAARGLARPLTESGRQEIVADVMKRSATSAGRAAANMDSPEYVPGSVPTTAQAADDSGLSLLEKSVRSRNPAEFASREAEQDAARVSALGRVFGTPAEVALAEQARDEATKAMREAAFANAKRVNIKPILSTADTILKTGSGKRQEVERAMAWVKDRLDGETDPERIYAVRQDINDIIAGKLAGNPEKASLQLASKELGAVKKMLDAQLEKSAPGFGDYLKTYAGMSREIDKAKLGQEITKDSINPLTERLSPAQFTRQFEKRGEEIAEAGPVASDALTRVAQDLRRSAAPAVAGRAPGSDTAQNLIGGNVLRSAVGAPASGPVSGVLAKPISMLYRATGHEDMVQNALLEAMLDPMKARALLTMRTTDPMVWRTQNALRSILLGGSIGIESGADQR